MSVQVTLPALGESVTEGTVTRWLKQVGDPVAVDEPLLEVSTDKVDTEIPAPSAGVLLEIRAPEDAVVEVGGVLAVIGEASEASGGATPAAPAAAPVSPPAAPPLAPPAPPAAAPMAAAAPLVAAPSAPPPSPPMGAPVSAFPPPPGSAIGIPDTLPSSAGMPEPASSSFAAVAPPVTTPTAAAPAGATGTDVLLPALGESVTEGPVTRWLKAVGDPVAADEPLLEVSTDKVDTEIPSPVAGTLLEIRVETDETAEVGTVLAVVGQAAASAPPTAAAPAPAPVTAAPSSAPVAPAPVAPAPVAAAPAAVAAGTAYVTPLVRKMARDAGVDLSRVTGTGTGGRIRREDVAAAAQSAPAGPAAPIPAAIPATAPVAPARPPVQASALRGTERMVESLQNSAQLTTVVEIDVTRIAALRQQHKAAFAQKHGVNLTYMPFFAYAAVEALKAHPAVNASLNLEAGTVTYHGMDNLGIAVDTDRGLIVPVIRNAEDMDIATLARAIVDVAARTRENKLSPDDLTGATFTLTNTGSRGALFDTPIISLPQSAILGTGTVVKRPMAVRGPDGEDTIGIRSMVYFALSYDHRLVDGADAARYLGDVKARLEDGNFIDQL